MNDEFFSQIKDTSDKKKTKKMIREQLENQIEIESSDGNTNKIALALKIVGWITLIVGIIAGIIIAVDHEINELVASLWIGSIITMISFLGFAEIIQLLQDIKNKMK